MRLKDVCYLPSGRIFLHEFDDGYVIESTEMRDVTLDGKQHCEVRETEDPRVVWKHLVPYEKKWLLTVSTQKGCAYNCRFCDVAGLPFKGNLTTDEILEQVERLLYYTPYVRECEKAKIGFARMGEPALNLDNVLKAMTKLKEVGGVRDQKHITWLPCFNSIVPKKAEKYSWGTVLSRIVEVKEQVFDGFLHLQISCNSTDEDQRSYLFRSAEVASLEEMIRFLNEFTITNRTITLNFIVMKGIEVSVQKLLSLGLNKEKFTVKLIPLNETQNAKQNELETVANYSSYQKLQELAWEFEDAGIPVVYDAIAKCEEAGLCCGQLAQIYL
jgi:23S rRNA (adenine2503-C2)-methyltransferase